MRIIDTIETAENFSITRLTSGSVVDNKEEIGELHLPQDQYYYLSTEVP